MLAEPRDSLGSSRGTNPFLLSYLASPSFYPSPGGDGSGSTAAAASGGGAAGSIDRDILARLTALQESVGDVRQEVAELRRAFDADDDVSFVSPTGKQYEAFADTKVGLVA